MFKTFSKGKEKIIIFLEIFFFCYLQLNTKKSMELIPKQMLKRLPIVFAQVKAGNTSENLLNKIRKIIYSLYQAKWKKKKVYNNIMNE